MKIELYNKKNLSMQIAESINLEELQKADAEILKNVQGTIIGTLSSKELLSRVSQFSVSLKIVLGLRDKIDVDTQILVTEYLHKYYNHLAFGEVMQAFDLLVIGELDNYIKEDDKKHYQVFSIDYLGRVLKAYNSRKQIALSRAKNILDKKAIDTKLQVYDSDRFKKTINEVFECYKQSKTYREDILRACVMFKILNRAFGLPRIEISSNHIKKGFKHVDILKANRVVNTSLLIQGKEETTARAFAEVEATKETIEQFFEKLIAEDKELVIDDKYLI